MAVFVSTPASEALAATGPFRMNPAGGARVRSSHTEATAARGSEDVCAFNPRSRRQAGRHVDRVSETRLAQGGVRSTGGLLRLR